MKYEYLKGSEKDFEGAPEWATIKGFLPGYEDSKDFLEGLFVGAKWQTESGSLSEISIPGLFIVASERRPITEPVVNQQLTTEWCGEGLPPVGSDVEVMMYRGCGSDVDLEWGIEKVLGHDGDVIIVASGERYGDYNGINKDFFRPIRSPEDVARDEAVNAMTNLARECDSETDHQFSTSLYCAIAAGKIPGIALSGK